MADLLTTEPKAGDSKNNLLFKWVEEVCGPGVAKIADSDNILLSKILRCTINNGGGAVDPPDPPPDDPTVDFSANDTSGVEQTLLDGPFTVIFTNESDGDFDSYEWDFGDGTTSTSENPSHPYPSAGTYTVTLTGFLSGGGGTVQEEKIDYIVVIPPPVFLELDSDFVTALGNSVSQMEDVSGNGRHVNAGSNPTLVLNQLNGHPSVSFNGTSNYLKTALNWANSPKTWIAVFKMNSGVDSQRMIADIVGGSRNRIQVGFNASSGEIVGACSNSIVGPTVNTAVYIMVSIRFFGNKFRVSGVDYSDGTVYATSTFTDLVLGCNFNGGVPVQFANFDFCALKVWVGALTDAQILARESPFVTKYAL